VLAMSFAALHAKGIEARTSLYDRIAERNLFQLHAPTVVADAPSKPPPLRKVTLTGITTLGKLAAYITIEGIRAQPAESVILTEGQTANNVEVKSIDEKAGIVRILNGDEMQILNFDSAKSPLILPIQAPVTSPLSGPQAPARAEPAMTAEEQTALIELQRLKFQLKGNPIHALLPPTELTSNDEEAATP